MHETKKAEVKTVIQTRKDETEKLIEYLKSVQEQLEAYNAGLSGGLEMIEDDTISPQSLEKLYQQGLKKPKIFDLFEKLSEVLETA